MAVYRHIQVYYIWQYIDTARCTTQVVYRHLGVLYTHVSV